MEIASGNGLCWTSTVTSPAASDPRLVLIPPTRIWLIDIRITSLLNLERRVGSSERYP